MKPSLANKNVIESYCTTGQFAKRDRTYHKHCGPTAITNLVLTLRPDLANAPAQVFDEVAALGRRLLAYWNIGAGKWLGGTSDGLAGLYLRQALNRFDCGNVKVRFGGLATVKTHVSHILQKLGVKRRSEAKTMAEKLHLL